MELRAVRESEKRILPLSRLIADMASMIETNLSAQVKLSNIKFGVFVSKQEIIEQKREAQLEKQMAKGHERTTSPLKSVKSVSTKGPSSLLKKIESSLTKMVKTLNIPHQCLIIAWIYVSRAVSRMRDKLFCLSEATAEK
jgi:hypothetical protein